MGDDSVYVLTGNSRLLFLFERCFDSFDDGLRLLFILFKASEDPHGNEPLALVCSSPM